MSIKITSPYQLNRHLCAINDKLVAELIISLQRHGFEVGTTKEPVWHDSDGNVIECKTLQFNTTDFDLHDEFVIFNDPSTINDMVVNRVAGDIADSIAEQVMGYTTERKIWVYETELMVNHEKGIKVKLRAGFGHLYEMFKLSIDDFCDKINYTQPEVPEKLTDTKTLSVSTELKAGDVMLLKTPLSIDQDTFEHKIHPDVEKIIMELVEKFDHDLQGRYIRNISLLTGDKDIILQVTTY